MINDLNLPELTIWIKTHLEVEDFLKFVIQQVKIHPFIYFILFVILVISLVVVITCPMQGAEMIFVIIIGIILAQVDLEYNRYKNDEVEKVVNNISIEKKLEKYPLQLLPNKLFDSDTEQFIINDIVLNLKQKQDTKYVEVKNKEDEYIILEEYNYIYDELPTFNKNTFELYFENLKTQKIQYFYKIKEIGYVSIYKN